MGKEVVENLSLSSPELLAVAHHEERQVAVRSIGGDGTHIDSRGRPRLMVRQLVVNAVAARREELRYGNNGNVVDFVRVRFQHGSRGQDANERVKHEASDDRTVRVERTDNVER